MDQDIEEAAEKAKNDKSAKQVKQRRVSMWLNDSPGSYRDPNRERKG